MGRSISTRDLAAALIRYHEGERLVAYDDATGEPIVAGYTLKGHPTISVGRNLAARGITKDESDYLLLNDLDAARDIGEDFATVPIWFSMTAPRRAALMDAAHALGPSGLNAFRRMRVAVRAEDWPTAAREFRDSKWARDMAALGSPRVETLARILETGEMPEGWA